MGLRMSHAPIDANMVLIFSLLGALRHRLGAKACRKDGVGWTRRHLEEMLPDNGSGPIIEARRNALAALKLVCQTCEKDCPLSGHIKRKEAA